MVGSNNIEVGLYMYDIFSLSHVIYYDIVSKKDI